MSKNDKDKKKNKSSASLYFLAAAVITAVMVKVIMDEGRKIKEENDPLAFDVYW